MMRWYVDSPGEFYTCGESTVIYFHPPSGNTHLLSEFAGHLLQLLISQPMGLDQLAKGSTSSTSADELAELTSAIPTILADLIELDVVTLT